MKLGELIKVLGPLTRITITKLAYFKSSKKYYSFLTMTDQSMVQNCTFSDDDLNLDVVGIRIDCPENYPILFIDVIEWINDIKEES